MEWRELWAVWLDRRERSLVVFVVRAVAVNARGSRGNGRMRCLKYRVVAVTAVHFQLSRMQRMAERNRLLWLVANI